MSAVIFGAIIVVMVVILITYAYCYSPPAKKWGEEVFYDSLEEDVRYHERKMERLEND